jgi:hypothetical protein
MEAIVWKDIPSYEGYYQVSNDGQVRSLDRIMLWRGKDRFVKGKMLSLAKSDSQQYLTVALCKNAECKQFRVHTLVAMAFLGHKPRGYIMTVDHIDRNKLNNRVENLRVVPHRENTHNRENGKSSQLLGVYWCNTDKTWVSKIKIDGKPHVIGYFKSEEAASEAYKDVWGRYKETRILDYSMYKKPITSKYKGVHYDKRDKKWLSRFDISKHKKVLIGSFYSEIEAKNAYEDVVETYKRTGVLDEYKYKKQIRKQSTLKILNEQ